MGLRLVILGILGVLTLGVMVGCGGEETNLDPGADSTGVPRGHAAAAGQPTAYLNTGKPTATPVPAPTPTPVP